MGFFKEQLISKGELDSIIESNKRRFDANEKGDIEALYYPGRPVKLCVIDKGMVSWVSGIIITMAGSDAQCQMRVALPVGSGFFTSIELENTRSVGFDFEGEQNGVA